MPRQLRECRRRRTDKINGFSSSTTSSGATTAKITTPLTLNNNSPVQYNINTSEGDWNFEEMMFSMADKVAVQRYETDPDYRFLHDRVSDLFAHCLNRDIQLLKNTFNVDDHDHESSSSKCLEITMAAQWLDDRATLLCESVARRVFQHPNPQRDVKEEAGYAYRLRERLRKEVVEPLRKASDSLIITLIDPKSNSLKSLVYKMREKCLGIVFKL
ncbi:hypothetical protein GBA52_012377 [Prunus armeniaca]|nr:hypothetical protein GBA52_012377 [Prunus armeniaca]